MISPMTPPGTRVVCVKNTGIENVITLGAVYIVEEMVLLPSAVHAGTGALGFNIVAVQVRGVLCPGCGRHLANLERAAFEYAALPEAITELLETKPVKTPEPVA